MPAFVSKAVAILDWIRRDLGRPVRVVELLDRYRIDRRTWSRWLVTLHEAGFVWVDQGRGEERTITVYRSPRPSGGRLIVADPAKPPRSLILLDDG